MNCNTASCLLRMSNPSSSNSSGLSGVAPSGAGRSEDSSGDVFRLCVRIHKRLCIPIDSVLPTADHQKAAELMLRVRDLLVDKVPMNSDSKARLMSSGIACWKRVCGDDSDDASCKQLRTTVTLLFVLLVLAESSDDMEEDRYEVVKDDASADKDAMKTVRVKRDDELLIDHWLSSSIADSLFEDGNAHASSWAEALKSEALVSRAALREARYLRDESDMFDFERLAFVFFQTSNSAAISSIIGTQPGQHEADFVTLDGISGAAQTANHSKEMLEGVADAAESELGQTVLRDMILSFKLPVSVVGVRRTLLLSRDANATATKFYTTILNDAHDAAMRGASWSFREDKDKIHNACSLLAGLAVIMAKSKEGVRKSRAFDGRVQLPFLQTRPPDDGVDRLALVNGIWLVYAMRKGQPRVRVRGAGYDGLCSGVLYLIRSKG